MNWEPRPTRFWEDFPEPPKEHFRLSDERRLQAEYMLKHPEIRALTSLLIAHMSKKPLTDRYRHKTLEQTARFFMRPAEILQAEIDELLKKKGRVGAGPKMEKKYDSRHIAITPAVVVPDCICPDQTPSIESVYSDFISISTSATSLPSVTEPVRKRMADKVPIKVNRLKHHFNGYVETEDYLLLKRKDIVETINYRKGTFNRYPKDEFGVYCSNYDEGTEMSTTVEPTCSFPDEEENKDGENTIEEISLQSEEVE